MRSKLVALWEYRCRLLEDLGIWESADPAHCGAVMECMKTGILENYEHQNNQGGKYTCPNSLGTPGGDMDTTGSLRQYVNNKER
jgi:hypothetical protein